MEKLDLNQLLQSFNSLTKEEQESAIHMLKQCEGGEETKKEPRN